MGDREVRVFAHHWSLPILKILKIFDFILVSNLLMKGFLESKAT